MIARDAEGLIHVPVVVRPGGSPSKNG